MTHPVLSEHPRMVALDQALADLQQAERASKARVALALEPYHEALAKWEVEADQQILNGDDPAERPSEPDLGADQRAAHLFLQRRTQLQAERKATLVAIAGEVERDAQVRERKLLSDARKLIRKLEVIAAEDDQLLAAVRQVRTAVDSTGDERPVPPRTSRMRDRVTVATVVELVPQHGSAFDLEPVPGLPLPVGSDEPEPPAREPIPGRGVQL